MNRRSALPLANRAAPPWTADLWLRMRRLFLLKLVGTSAFTWLFFVAYFQLLRHPVNPVVVLPLTALDHWIPFQPAALPAYLSLWLYVGVAPGLQLRFRELVVYGLWIGALCVSGLAIFYAWPTAIPALAAADLGHSGFRMLQSVDAAGNACPSMHVAVAIFTALRLDPLLRDARAPLVLRLINLAWFAAIAWSTLATKQHVVLDVAAGALLGAAFALASLRWAAPPRRGVAAPVRADIIDRMSTDIAP
ncbi:MAG TPA: phosphatase PAP2 family protein [Burkholderiaceae bacterium]|nr:phosphatase PAP2 family protein [Burkholderiaceae bacterium]